MKSPVMPKNEMGLKQNEINRQMDVFQNKIYPDLTMDKVHSFMGNDRICLPLLANSLMSQEHLAYCWSQILFSEKAPPPTAIFLGGSQENMRIVIFNRPLTIKDFQLLWNSDHRENQL